MLFYILCIFLCFGSFLNVVIYRLPKGESFILSRSYCPCCNHKLSPLELIPVISYLALGGKCRCCKRKISLQYPIVELISGWIGIFCYLKYGLSLEFIFNSLIFELLLVISIVDIQTMTIPDEFNFILFLLAILRIFIYDYNYYEHILSLLLIPTFLIIMNKIIPNSFGYGDIKFMFSMGLYLNCIMTILSFILSILIAGIYSILLILLKKVHRKTMIPFAPFLSLGILLGITNGSTILNCYINLFS